MKVLPKVFPYNANKKQSAIWFTIWTLAAYFNLAVYTLFVWLFAGVSEPNNNSIYIAAFTITTLGYTMVLIIIYTFVKSIVVKRLKNKEND